MALRCISCANVTAISFAAERDPGATLQLLFIPRLSSASRQGLCLRKRGWPWQGVDGDNGGWIVDYVRRLLVIGLEIKSEDARKPTRNDAGRA